MRRVDLHSHSRFSDGTLTPAELVAHAKKSGVEILFLTDHDSVSGFTQAREAAAEGLEVHCGIEINTCHKDQVHVLGYGFDWKSEAFLKKLEEFRARRELRAKMIVENLRACGLEISFEDVQSTSHETLGRPHVADALIRKHLVGSRQEAFNRWLIRGKPGYVEPMGPTPLEAVELIRAAGGFSSLAHPETVKDLEPELPAWIEAGLGGLEVHYAAYKAGAVKRYAELADKYGLLRTGGSDFHGPGTGRTPRMGVEMPDEDFDRFWKRYENAIHRA
jgi:3',5'-nucleoside bisphosphate phosphatase